MKISKIKLQTFCGASILLLTVLISIADSSINNFNTGLLEMENKANTALLAEIASTNALNELELFDILNIQLTPATFSRSPQVDMDPAFEAAANKFYSGSMSWHDYLLFSINFFSEQTQENHDQDTLAEQTVN